MGLSSSKVLCYYNGTHNEYYNKSTNKKINQNDIELIIIKKLYYMLYNNIKLKFEVWYQNNMYYYLENEEIDNNDIVKRIFFTQSAIENLIHKVMPLFNTIDEYLLQVFRFQHSIEIYIILDPKRFIRSSKSPLVLSKDVNLNLIE